VDVGLILIRIYVVSALRIERQVARILYLLLVKDLLYYLVDLIVDFFDTFAAASLILLQSEILRKDSLCMQLFSMGSF
jgi:hypothetical protein